MIKRRICCQPAHKADDRASPTTSRMNANSGTPVVLAAELTEYMCDAERAEIGERRPAQQQRRSLRELQRQSRYEQRRTLR